MSDKLRASVNNPLSLEKARRLLELVQDKISNGDIKEPEHLLSEIFQAFEKLFAGLKKPVTDGMVLDKDAIRSSKEYEKVMKQIAADLDILISSAKAMTEAATGSFNFAATRQRMLDTEIKKVTSTSADVQLLTDVPGANVMIAGDDFVDGSKIDRSIKGEGSPAEIVKGSLGMGLKRSGSANALDPEEATVDVESADVGAYEGMYWAPLGEAIPEGGSFHWKAGKKPLKAGWGMGSLERLKKGDFVTKPGWASLSPSPPASANDWFKAWGRVGDK